MQCFYYNNEANPKNITTKDGEGFIWLWFAVRTSLEKPKIKACCAC